MLATVSFELVMLGFAAVLSHPPIPRRLGLHNHVHWLYILCIGIQGGSQVTMVRHPSGYAFTGG